MPGGAATQCTTQQRPQSCKRCLWKCIGSVGLLQQLPNIWATVAGVVAWWVSAADYLKEPEWREHLMWCSRGFAAPQQST